jgi:hypothetical protein
MLWLLSVFLLVFNDYHRKRNTPYRYIYIINKTLSFVCQDYFLLMLLLIICIGFFISNLSFATIEKNFFPKEQCKLKGDLCQCCSNSDCYIVEGRFIHWFVFFRSLILNIENKHCLPSIINERWKRNSEDFIIPPYYNPNNQLYPYGISKPVLPFYKAPISTQALESKKMGNYDWYRLNKFLFFSFRMGSLSISWRLWRRKLLSCSFSIS